MKRVKAIICDVYRTLLDVRETPADAEKRWAILFQGVFGKVPCSPFSSLAPGVGKRIDSTYEPGERSGAWIKHRRTESRSSSLAVTFPVLTGSMRCS